MKRWLISALVLSVALNVGFGLAWVAHKRAFDQGASWHERLHGRGSDHEGRRGWRDRGGHGDQHDHGERRWAERRAHRLHRELDLEPARRDALRDALAELEPGIADTRRELMLARRGFAEAMHVDEPDREEVMQLRGEVSRLQAQLDSLVAEALLRESSILDLHERERFGPWSPLHGGHHSHEEKER